jgi:translation initiation factor 1A
MPRGVQTSRNIKNNRGLGGRELPLANREDQQCYGKVEKMFGGGRMMLLCDDNVPRMGKIRGRMKKSEWISVGDTVLLSLRAFEDNKADVLARLTEEEYHKLKRLGHLDDLVKLLRKKADEQDADNNENLIDFDKGGSDVDEGDEEGEWINTI